MRCTAGSSLKQAGVRTDGITSGSPEVVWETLLVTYVQNIRIIDTSKAMTTVIVLLPIRSHLDDFSLFGIRSNLNVNYTGREVTKFCHLPAHIVYVRL